MTGVTTKGPPANEKKMGARGIKTEERRAHLRQRDAGRLRPPVAQVKADAQAGRAGCQSPIFRPPRESRTDVGFISRAKAILIDVDNVMKCAEIERSQTVH